MKYEGSSASDLVFARHTNSSAETGFVDSSASPTAAATLLRNQAIVVVRVTARASDAGQVETPAVELVDTPEDWSVHR